MYRTHQQQNKIGFHEFHFRGEIARSSSSKSCLNPAMTKISVITLIHKRNQDNFVTV